MHLVNIIVALYQEPETGRILYLQHWLIILYTSLWLYNCKCPFRKLSWSPLEVPWTQCITLLLHVLEHEEDGGKTQSVFCKSVCEYLDGPSTKSTFLLQEPFWKWAHESRGGKIGNRSRLWSHGGLKPHRHWWRTLCCLLAVLKLSLGSCCCPFLSFFNPRIFAWKQVGSSLSLAETALRITR